MRTKRILKGEFCSICHGQLYTCPSGVVCKNGHGGVDAAEDMIFGRKPKNMASAIRRRKGRGTPQSGKPFGGKFDKKKSDLFEQKMVCIPVYYDSPDNWVLKDIPCHYIGNYGYHKHFKEGWSVIHLPTGIMVFTTKKEKTAKYVVKQCDRLLESGWTPKQREVRDFLNWYHSLESFRFFIGRTIAVLDGECNRYSEEYIKREMSGDDDIPF